jgi:hypothetical protein
MGPRQGATSPVASRLVLTVLLISVSGTLICWRLASINEDAHIQRMTRLAASAVAASSDGFPGPLAIRRRWRGTGPVRGCCRPRCVPGNRRNQAC